MTGQSLDTREVLINGNRPGLSASGELTGLDGAAVAGTVKVPGHSIAFYSLPGASNPVCR